jgi:tetratricopeptide (TPR) repeat protein
VDVTIGDRTAPHVGAVVKVDSRVIAGPKVDPPNGVRHVPMSPICPTKSKPANSTKLFDLLSLDKNNATAVARHMVMAGKLVDDDPELALQHARAARQRAGRIAVVRETAGLTAYHAGEWAEALSELRAARRMAGGPGHLAVMADCERGLGRPERAIELGRSDEARQLTGDEASELRIVVAGARMDLMQFDQAVVTLQTPDLDASRSGTPAARLFYVYADALVAAGRVDEGIKWFLNAAAADIEGETDAEERVEELSGNDQ